MTDPGLDDESQRQRWGRESRAIEQDERDHRSLMRRRTAMLLIAAGLTGYLVVCALVVLQLT